MIKIKVKDWDLYNEWINWITDNKYFYKMEIASYDDRSVYMITFQWGLYSHGPLLDESEVPRGFSFYIES